MKAIALLLVAALAASPLSAQDSGSAEGDTLENTAPETGGADLQEGVDMLSEGARRVLRGLMGEVEPRMRELADALEDWDFRGIGVEDLGAYHPPEMLPNGDIIIRRKTPVETDDPMDGEIEL